MVAERTRVTLLVPIPIPIPVAVPVPILILIAVAGDDHDVGGDNGGVAAILVSELILGAETRLVTVLRDAHVRADRHGGRCARRQRERRHDGTATHHGGNLRGKGDGDDANHRDVLRAGGGPLPGEAPFPFDPQQRTGGTPVTAKRLPSRSMLGFGTFGPRPAHHGRPR